MSQDDYLYDFREEPRAAFRLALKERLSAEEERPIMPVATPWPALRPQRQWALSVGFVLLLVLTFIPISANQTFAQVLYHWVAGLAFIESDYLPTEDPLYKNELVVLQQPQEFEVELAMAQQIVPFLLPTWLPDGYTLAAVTRRDVGAQTSTKADDVVEIRVDWKRGGAQISLDVVERDIPILVNDLQNVEEFVIGTTPIALLHGMWDTAENSYVLLEFKTYSWESGGLFYHLSGYSSDLSEAEAVQIIDSILVQSE